MATTSTQLIELTALPKIDNVTLGGDFDPAALTMPVVVEETPRSSIGREAGEKDPLLLRGRIIGDGELNELRQCVRDTSRNGRDLR
jgi:hypothetical protein